MRPCHLGEMARLSTFSTAAIVVFQTNDIVLGKMVSDLHLDENERLFPVVENPVRYLARHEDRMSGRYPELVPTDCYQTLPGNHDPMFGSVLVILQGHALSSCNLDSLDYKSIVRSKNTPVPPWAGIGITRVIVKIIHTNLQIADNCLDQRHCELSKAEFLERREC